MLLQALSPFALWCSSSEERERAKKNERKDVDDQNTSKSKSMERLKRKHRSLRLNIRCPSKAKRIILLLTSSNPPRDQTNRHFSVFFHWLIRWISLSLSLSFSLFDRSIDRPSVSVSKCLLWIIGISHEVATLIFVGPLAILVYLLFFRLHF